MKYTRDEINYKLEEIVYGDKKEHNRRVHIFKMVVIAAAIILMTTVCSFGIGMFSGIFANVPDLENVSFGPEGYASRAYDTEGNLIATLVQEGSNREEVTYEELPEDLINAFVAIEDQRFWEHNGIDLRSIMRAVRGVITGNDAGGGSTITQQLIKNNILKGGNEDGVALYERKFQEWYIALMIENQPGVDKIELKKRPGQGGISPLTGMSREQRQGSPHAPLGKKGARLMMHKESVRKGALRRNPVGEQGQLSLKQASGVNKHESSPVRLGHPVGNLWVHGKRGPSRDRTKGLLEQGRVRGGLIALKLALGKGALHETCLINL